MKALLKRYVVALGIAAQLFTGSAALGDQPGPIERPKPPTAEAVLKLARQGRIDFLTTVVDLQRFAITMTEANEIYSYIMILDELEKLAQGYQIETFGNSPLADLAGLLTRNAIKFVRFDLDAPAKWKAFLKWSEDATRSLSIQSQVQYIQPLKDKGELLHWHEIVLACIDQLIGLKASIYVMQSYDETQGIIVRRILELKQTLTHDEKKALFLHTKSTDALTEVLEYLRQETVVSKDPVFLKEAISWGLGLNTNLKNLNRPIPLHLRVLPGQIVAETLTTLLMMEVPLEIAKAKEILDALQPAQVSEIGSNLVQLYSHRLIPDHLLDFLYALTDGIYKKLAPLSSPEKMRDLGRFQQRLALLKLSH